VAFGFSWQGREVRKGKVLYLAAEGRRGIGKRIKAWLQHTGETTLPETFVLLPTAVNLLREAEREALVEMARRLDFDLVVIDTLARSMVGARRTPPGTWASSSMGPWTGSFQLVAVGRLPRPGLATRTRAPAGHRVGDPGAVCPRSSVRRARLPGACPPRSPLP
jgi:hypothetical protein